MSAVTEQDEFFDEKVLEYRKRARKEKYNSLETGMYIKDELVSFSERKLFQEQVAIMLPELFVNMPLELAKIKYPSEQRPQIILTNADTRVNFCFNLFTVKITSDDIPDAVRQFKMLMSRMNPAYVFYHTETKKTENLTIGWYDFKSYCIDDNLYNLVFITVIHEKLFHGMFNCLYKDAVEWQDVLPQIMESIREEK